MRTLTAAVLAFEAVVVALAVPTAVALGHGGPRVVVGGLLLAVACLVCAGLTGRRAGLVGGSALQALVLLTGLVLPAMVVLGLLFTGLWVTALVLPGRADAERARRGDASAPPPAG